MNNTKLLGMGFPDKLFALLRDADRLGFEDIISWHDDGTSFKVHDSKRFSQEIIPQYFRKIKYTSFQRQLSIYCFSRIRTGRKTGEYFHPYFRRDSPELCDLIHRYMKPDDETSYSNSKEEQMLISDKLETNVTNNLYGLDLEPAPLPFPEKCGSSNPVFDREALQAMLTDIDPETNVTNNLYGLDLEPTPLPFPEKCGSSKTDFDQEALQAMLTDIDDIPSPYEPQDCSRYPHADGKITVCSSTFDIPALFPTRLHQLLEDAETHNFQDIISWIHGGRAFQVLDQEKFVQNILPLYFTQSKFSSFRRQLNLYGFIPIKNGTKKQRIYCHENFVKNNQALSLKIRRLDRSKAAREQVYANALFV